MGKTSKPKPVPRSVVEGYLRAFASRDPDRIEVFLDEDVDWAVTGPVELLRFCGQRHGIPAVREFFSILVPEVLKFKSYELEDLLVDGDRSAVFAKISGLQVKTGRVISYRIALFMRWRNKKIFHYRALIDSFDAAEQILGHRFDFDDAPHLDKSSNLVSV